ncbi:hypothetical protein DSO57_1026283 [Entomophthora muscae]|uniref:Uncharacterized protein n=1 Tax=Entomophthora muscae TaxID=34485 RepID=A0ACC2SF24_9FUNG|nr:hypothetical protein DSO57_1026283 [Entomophthora muscae]
MLEIPPTPLLPTVPPAQDFSKLGFVCITVLGLANQVVPHTGSWCSLATAVNYLIRITPIVYLASQDWSTSPAGVQPDSVMGHDNDRPFPLSEGSTESELCCDTFGGCLTFCIGMIFWNPSQIQ